VLPTSRLYVSNASYLPPKSELYASSASGRRSRVKKY
jgi:hypothetical protein